MNAHSRTDANAGTGEGVAIVHDGRHVALKWHRLRRNLSDRLFDAEILRLGHRLGASMEIDLRATCDGGFALLHDATLDRETGGTGRIAQLTRDRLAEVFYDDGNLPANGSNRRRLMLVENLAPLMTGGHPDALLQLDMKEDLAAIGDRGLACLEGLLDGAKTSVVVSGECLTLIAAFRHLLPDVRRGIDPTERLVALVRGGRTHDLSKRLVEEINGPCAPEFVYLDWRLILVAWDAGVDLVGICHGEGRKVDAWTFNLSNPAKGFDDGEWSAFRKLIELGVDQITTDEPPDQILPTWEENRPAAFRFIEQLLAAPVA